MRIPAYGVGTIPQLSQQYCDSSWSLLNPVAWLGGCVGPDVANFYEKVQYGEIPRPASLPLPPVPGPPAADGTPGVVTADDWKQWGSDVRASLQTAEDNGTWNPQGNLPVNALDLTAFWNKYGTYVMIGGAVVGGLILMNVLGGRR